MPEQPVKSSADRLDESVTCDICGRFGAIQMGDRVICPDCYGQNCGSCCPEFGKKDA